MRRSALIGLGLAAALASTAAAQQTGQAAQGEKPHGATHERFERRGGAPDGFLLRGITLSEAQKTQLKQLRESEHQTMEAGREGGRSEMKKAREARQHGDTAAARAIAQRQRQAMQHSREQHVAAVRNILTAEQRAQFDKNVAELKQRPAQQGERFGARGAKRGRVGGGR